MKVSKKQLQRIIKEEKRKLLNEGGVGIGFANWEVNRSPDFAKAYGKDARVLHDFGSNAARQDRLREQDLAGGSVENMVSAETGEFQNALDDLDMDLRNAIQLAIDRGLILDDITDALALAEEFAEMQLRV